MGISYESCTLCPRRCGVNRAAGVLGFCRMGGHVRVARAAPHYWEEPVLSEGGGSGTVFFSGCTLRCSFCQNSRISRDGFGEELDKGRLRGILEQLVDAGVENINLVTPTHFLPDILPALEPKLPVPVVYNCGGYERVETLRELESHVDVYLPDLKYMDSRLADRLSAAAEVLIVYLCHRLTVKMHPFEYPEVVRGYMSERLFAVNKYAVVPIKTVCAAIVLQLSRP